ncbi:MAG: M48 family metallopeptidase [Candidatus Omnitrophota bacterium]
MPLNNEVTSEKARQYQAAKRRLFLVRMGLTVLFLLAWLLTGASHSLKVWLLGYQENFFFLVALYFACFAVVSFFFSLPLDIFEEFFLERRFGLSRQSWRAWSGDVLKSGLLAFVVSLISIEGVYFFLSQFPSFWWLWAAFFWFFLSIVMARIFPRLVLPLFFKVKPLEEGDLRQRLFTLFGRFRVRLKEIMVLDFSKKTVKANAMVSGLGSTKQIFLADTLLENFAPAEIEAVLAHELGHYLRHDTAKLVFTSLASALFSFAAAHLIFSAFLPVFGFAAASDVAALPLLLLILFGAGLLLLPLQNGFSRRLERRADAFALEATASPDAFISMMRRLGERNLADFQPPRWVEFFFYDHPPIGKRIAMARRFIHAGENI